MTVQSGANARQAYAAQLVTDLGASGVTLEMRTSALPANCAAADGAGLFATLALPATPLQSSAGVFSKTAGAWSGTASAAGITLGNPGHFRLKNSGGTCIQQGTLAVNASLATSAALAANGNVLTFATSPITAGMAVGMKLSGTGIPTGAKIIAVTPTTVTMDVASTAGVGSGVTVTASGDMGLDGAVSNGQAINVPTYSFTVGDA